MTHHLAQLNIARLVASRDDPQVAEFMENLERVNGIGRRSPGFVWLMEGEEGAGAGNTDVAIDGDPRLIANLSLWEDVASLRAFVFNTLHKRFLARSSEWFEAPEGPRFVMWWVEAGARPTLGEGLARLEHLRTHGPSDHAFGWASVSADATTDEKADAAKAAMAGEQL